MEVKKIIALILGWIQVISGYPTLEKEFDAEAEAEAAKAEYEISKSKSSKKMAEAYNPYEGTKKMRVPQKVKNREKRRNLFSVGDGKGIRGQG